MSVLRFEHLTPGYCGRWVARSTLNSQFLGMVSERYLSNDVAFPCTQRIPRYGFFEEVESCETAAARAQIRNYRELVSYRLKQYEQISERRSLDLKEGQFALSLFNLLMRLGETRSFKLNFSSSDQLISWQISWNDIAINKAVSAGVHPSFTRIAEIARAHLADEKVKVASKILICIRAIATISRHLRDSSTEARSLLNQAFIYVEKEIPKFQPSTFQDSIIHSMALRALPMKSGMDCGEKIELVRGALESIDAIKCSDPLQKVIAKELRYTTLLTYVKTMIDAGAGQSQSESLYESLIQCDPVDSTGFSELAMFQMRRQLKTVAIESFKKAIALGPPAFAMNYYFLGKLQMELGDSEQAISNWEECSNIDSTALSPVIDRIHYFTEQNQLQRAKELKAQLLANIDLTDQLNEEDERVLSKI